MKVAAMGAEQLCAHYVQSKSIDRLLYTAAVTSCSIVGVST